jgi:hypothetical protein
MSESRMTLGEFRKTLTGKSLREAEKLIDEPYRLQVYNPEKEFVPGSYILSVEIENEIIKKIVRFG